MQLFLWSKKRGDTDWRKKNGGRGYKVSEKGYRAFSCHSMKAELEVVHAIVYSSFPI